MPRVDYWLLADNSISPRVIVAEGYQHGEDRIYELELLNASRIMSNNEMQELSDKLRRGLQLAEKRLLEKMLAMVNSLVRNTRWKSNLCISNRIAGTFARKRKGINKK